MRNTRLMTVSICAVLLGAMTESALFCWVP